MPRNCIPTTATLPRRSGERTKLQLNNVGKGIARPKRQKMTVSTAALFPRVRVAASLLKGILVDADHHITQQLRTIGTPEQYRFRDRISTGHRHNDRRATNTCLSPMTNSRRSTVRSSTLGRQQIQRLFDNPPSHETIRSEVQLLVDGGNTQAIRGLSVGDQTRFLEIVDQVSPLLRGRL